VEPSTGSDPATVKTSGVDFPYPEYLRNLVAQVYRRWRRPSGQASLRAEVLFFVHRDGSITNFQFVKRSGNFGFDLEAQGAIEAASNAGAFGPLPDGYPSDVLPVSFFFDPSSMR
jgi:protein TonB